MRILFLTSQLPYSGIAGGHSLVFERMLRLSRRGHEVGLVSFCDEECHKHISNLQKNLLEVETLPRSEEPTLFRKFILTYFAGIPLPYICPELKAMKRVIGDMVHRSHYDVVIAEFSIMGPYLYKNPYLPAVRKIISCHHSPTIMAQRTLDLLGFSLSGLKKWIKMKGLQWYEFKLYRRVDRVLTLTPQERYALLNLDPTLRISVVPNGVDADYYQAPEETPHEQAIIFTGNYADAANVDAMRSFTRNVWPLLRKKQPNLRFYIVGPSPPEFLRRLGERDDRVMVTGRVDDLRPYLERAQVFVCPVRIGRGMRGKILEAMASGLPVVSTSLGVEGIAAQMGDNCYIADTPDIMRHYINLLLEDHALRRTLAENARSMVEERFAWPRVLSQLEQVIKEVMTG